jgi:ABC-type polysaccharide/polyol phosphate transport system ATPase subunit
MNSLITSKASAPGASPVIDLTGVAVRYRAAQERIPSIKEYVVRRLRGQVRYRDFWALQDISLQVRAGEILGIIGSNGAGKSTLLKVIARVLKPTRGRVRIRGRVSPLLELGAGFVQELTGRENVYLNSAILGFSKKETETRFDRIVDFAGLRQFIDTPIRNYSTGMVARLGFSVATDVRPEILIVDEILGVGDAEFQTRSFERIQRFQAEGTTILLVSHDLNRVEAMCSHVIWLENGQVVASGSASAVVSQYRQHTTDKETRRLIQAGAVADAQRWGSQKIEITALRITNAQGQPQSIFCTGDPLVLTLEFYAHESVAHPVFGMAIHRSDGTHVTGPNSHQLGLETPITLGAGAVRFTIPYLPLLEGLYFVTVAALNESDTEIFDFHDHAYAFRVVNRGGAVRETYGLMTVRGDWEWIAKQDDLPGG